METRDCFLLLTMLAIFATVIADASKSKHAVEKNGSSDEKIEKRRILIWVPMSTKSHYITFKVKYFLDILTLFGREEYEFHHN